MHLKTIRIQLFILYGLALNFIACNQSTNNTDPFDNFSDWAVYRGDKKGNQYSELDQINKENVKELSVAWEYHHGKPEGPSMYSNPIIIDGLLYFTSPTLDAICINAVTGKEVWRFTSSTFNKNKEIWKGRNRGLAYHKSKDSERIFLFAKNRVYAIEAKTGKHISTFGKNGYIDLNYDLDMDPAKASVEVTTPGIVYKDHLIIGGRVPEGYNSTPGDIRSYNAITGAFEWIFHTVPKKNEEGYETWSFLPDENYGGANPWGGFTVDEERGWVFCATGSPAPDFIYGGTRKGANLYGNCILAIDANTGKKVWHYQNIHHDIFDYDNPPAPILATIMKEDKPKDVVVQFTKMGLTFILDRDTGQPLFQVNEEKVGNSTIADEASWPTQPIPVLPKPLVRTHFTKEEITNISQEAHDFVLDKFNKYDTGPLYTPANEKGVITTPGHQGGIEWGGGAFNPESNIIFVNANEAPTINKLVKYHDFKSDDISPALKGYSIYRKNCTSCHGTNKKGKLPGVASLENIALTKNQIIDVLRTGRGNMPSFQHLGSKELENLAIFLKTNETDLDNLTEDGVIRYSSDAPFLVDEEGYPGIKPPWGTLNALNVATGKLIWKIPFGSYPELVKRGLKNTGSKNFGGPIATKSGLIFIAATPDEKIRAYDQSNGELLWEHKLPAAGYATPSTYMIEGKQYLVIVCGGGGKIRSPHGDAVVAFVLN